MIGYGGYGLLGGLGMGVGMVVWILVIAVIAWALIALFGDRANRRGEAPDETPLEILKRRYAKGEIDEAEFERARQRLA